MTFKEEFIYNGEAYLIQKSENENILSPEIIEWIISQNDELEERKIVFHIENYKLKVQCFNEVMDTETKTISMFVPYSGGLILVKEFIQDYGNNQESECYCFKTVLEFIFRDGNLVTSIDHSKAMNRIRRNIDKGLRDVDNRRDSRCIQQFIDESFVQHYNHSFSQKIWSFMKVKLKKQQ